MASVTTRKRYAEGTDVTVERSRDEIERTLGRFGAVAFAWMRDDESGRVTVAFKRRGKSYRFIVPMPKPNDDNVLYTPSRRFARSATEITKALDTERRRRFRSLALYLKALLEAIDTGILHEEEVLLPYLILPGGDTVAEKMLPNLDRVLTGEEPLKVLR